MLENPCPQSIEFDAALLRATVLQRGRSREVQFLGGEGLQVAGGVVQPSASACHEMGGRKTSGSPLHTNEFHSKSVRLSPIHSS